MTENEASILFLILFNLRYMQSPVGRGHFAASPLSEAL